jgi:hypothetical protein
LEASKFIFFGYYEGNEIKEDGTGWMMHVVCMEQMKVND